MGFTRGSLTLSLAALLLAGCAGSADRHHTASAGEKHHTAHTDHDAPVRGWLNWRGPHQTGVTDAKDLPDKWVVGGENHRWSRDLPGRGTPVIGDGRLYAWGYVGAGQNQREILVAMDAETGREVWSHELPDFLSDHIYSRYSIGAPTIDPETGNVYLLTSPGRVICFSRDGEILWHHSLMEAYGRLTFPNGRVGAPVIDRHLVIVRGISANWGRQGPPRDRFYAFDKRSGRPVWAATPGVGPPYLYDSSFSTPVLDWRDGVRVFYAGTGCGNVVCVNASNGQPIWRYQLAVGGVNSSVVLDGHDVIAIHDKENVDSTDRGGMVRLSVDVDPLATRSEPELVTRDAEQWRNELNMFTSSPVIVNGRIYQVTHTGELHCVDAQTGRSLWHKKLGTSQLHASPLYGDGKLYVPMVDGDFYILKVKDDGVDVLSHVELAGSPLGSPAYWNGKVYVHTTEKLYCFGEARESDRTPPTTVDWLAGPAPGKAVALQAVPNEVLLRPGERVDFEVHAVDAKGLRVRTMKHADLSWEAYVPATAKVKARMDAKFDEAGHLVADADAEPSAGAFRVTADGLSGVVRGRVVEGIPMKQDFESFELDETNAAGQPFAYPPLPWIGARFKWEVREIDGNKALAKTTERLILQRAMTFFGDPTMHDYTIQADVMTERSRRLKGVVGVINQRYIIALKASHDMVEVVSNYDRVNVTTPFKAKADTWYTIKAEVREHADGSGTVLGKVWERGTDEPDEWTIRAEVPLVHKSGSPGVFGFGPQNQLTVYVDNIKVTQSAQTSRAD